MCCESRLDDREVVGPAYVLYEKATKATKTNRNQRKITYKKQWERIKKRSISECTVEKILIFAEEKRGKIHEKVCSIIFGSVNDCDGGQRLYRQKAGRTVCQ